MPNLGATELIIVLVIVLIIFGGAKLPKLARSLGEAKNEFEKSTKDGSAATPEAKVTSTTTTTSPADPQITMSKAEYDALVAERSNAAKKD